MKLEKNPVRSGKSLITKMAQENDKNAYRVLPWVILVPL
jgi:hypothetical protein